MFVIHTTCLNWNCFIGLLKFRDKIIESCSRKSTIIIIILEVEPVFDPWRIRFPRRPDLTLKTLLIATHSKPKPRADQRGHTVGGPCKIHLLLSKTWWPTSTPAPAQRCREKRVWNSGPRFRIVSSGPGKLVPAPDNRLCTIYLF